MRKGKGIAGATLLYGPNCACPDLVPVMQFLVDDLRAEGRRISGLRLGAQSLRLRADEYEIVLTLAQAPLPLRALDGVIRPAPLDPDLPDVSRARLIHSLRDHRHALGFLLRPRGAPTLDPDELAVTLAQMGRFCLLPVFEAAPPAMLVWQPGSLLFTRSEFLSSSALHLLSPPTQIEPLMITASHKAHHHRDSVAPRTLPPPDSRHQRAERRSGGRLFGSSVSDRPKAIPRLDTAHDAVSAALRAPIEQAKPHHGSRIAVALMWLALTPQLLGLWPV